MCTCSQIILFYVYLLPRGRFNRQHPPAQGPHCPNNSIDTSFNSGTADLQLAQTFGIEDCRLKSVPSRSTEEGKRHGTCSYPVSIWHTALAKSPWPATPSKQDAKVERVLGLWRRRLQKSSRNVQGTQAAQVMLVLEASVPEARCCSGNLCHLGLRMHSNRNSCWNASNRTTTASICQSAPYHCNRGRPWTAVCRHMNRRCRVGCVSFLHIWCCFFSLHLLANRVSASVFQWE
jgi:hypothetical protein